MLIFLKVHERALCFGSGLMELGAEASSDTYVGIYSQNKVEVCRPRLTTCSFLQRNLHFAICIEVNLGHNNVHIYIYSFLICCYNHASCVANILLLFFLSFQWVLAEQGCNCFSMVIVPLYDTLGPDACAFIINQGTVYLTCLCDSRFILR